MMASPQDRVSDAVQNLRFGKLEALIDLSELATGGNEWCHFVLGDTYLHGRYGAPKDFKLGQEHLLIAFEAGLLDAGHLLARYLSENGRKEDAYALFLKLVEKMYLPSLFQLGRGHLRNEWPSSNRESGQSLLETAAKHGHMLSDEFNTWFKIFGEKSIRKKLRLLIRLYKIKIAILYFRQFRRNDPSIKP
ncbi:MAG: hypothetical protein HRT56_07360 [Coraliomargarita sp.]|nr:hypothetical protein [Coraliomargarita sp.]